MTELEEGSPYHINGVRAGSVESDLQVYDVRTCAKLAAELMTGDQATPHTHTEKFPPEYNTQTLAHPIPPPSPRLPSCFIVLCAWCTQLLADDPTNPMYQPKNEYIRVSLPKPVAAGAEARVRIDKTYADDRSYFIDEKTGPSLHANGVGPIWCQIQEQ